jgi:hypothetical protein
MGMARLLAKGWVVVCLFAGAHALHFALAGTSPEQALGDIGVSTLLFIAMGLLFIGGYAAATDHTSASLLERVKPHHLLPGFNEIVFVAFVALSFVNQVAFAPQFMQNPAVNAIDAAIGFAVPGQRALEDVLVTSGLDGGRIFASAFAWLLAAIYLASAISRIRLAAGLVRLERAKRPEALGAGPLAFLLGVIAVVGIQFLYVGSAFMFLPASAYTEISGALILGLAPLMLAYLIVAALTNLLASGPEQQA